MGKGKVVMCVGNAMGLHHRCGCGGQAARRGEPAVSTPRQEFAEPKPYWLTGNEAASPDELARLKAELKELERRIDDPGWNAIERVQAVARAITVRARIQQIEAALHPKPRVGEAPTAGQSAARQFAAPTPYFRLSDAKRAELEAEVKGLRAKIAAPGLRPEVKQRLQQDLAKIEHLLGMDRSPTPDLRPIEERRLQD